MILLLSDGAQVVDYLTVNETANEPPSDEREGINNVNQLMSLCETIVTRGFGR